MKILFFFDLIHKFPVRFHLQVLVDSATVNNLRMLLSDVPDEGERSLREQKSEVSTSWADRIGRQSCIFSTGRDYTVTIRHFLHIYMYREKCSGQPGSGASNSKPCDHEFNAN